MTNSTANNLVTSDWCLDINQTEGVSLPSDNLYVDFVIESILVPMVGAFGIAGGLTVS